MTQTKKIGPLRTAPCTANDLTNHSTIALVDGNKIYSGVRFKCEECKNLNTFLVDLNPYDDRQLQCLLCGKASENWELQT